MAQVKLNECPQKLRPGRCHQGRRHRHRRWRIRRLRRPFRLREIDAAQDDRRARGHHLRHHRDRRHGRQRRPAQGSRHRHGLSVLCHLPAHVGPRECRLRPDDQGRRARPRRTPRWRKRRASCRWNICSTAGPVQLSGGQRQRVAIGRAIVRDPSVFLFDEPLSNLDAALRLDMRMEIGKLHQNLKASMIYVTHDQIEAMTLADKIVVLKDGAGHAGRRADGSLSSSRPICSLPGSSARRG